jgi:ATP-dependent DNA helicase DinG
MNLDEFFNPDGPLAAALGAGYQHRGEQVEMAHKVDRALQGAHALLADTLTGTGKSLAYLVPAALADVAEFFWASGAGPRAA